MEQVVEVKKERQSNIELLRILSMLMIVFHHFAVHGNFTFTATEVSFNHFWYYFISMGGKIGVDIFVLISGYFLVLSQKVFDLKKIFKLIGQVFFYSILIYSLFLILGKEEFSFSSLKLHLMPISHSLWWFASTYFVLYLLHPFINWLVRRITKREYQMILLMVFFLWCIIPTFLTVPMEGNNLLWFISLYLLASYIRLYGLNPKLKLKHYIILFIAFTILTLSDSIVFTIIGNYNERFANTATRFFGMQEISILAISVSLFMVFISLPIKHNKMINLISSATFGVYLIHDHYFMRKYLWTELFQNANYQNSNLLWIYSIGVCLLVFIVCVLIDLVRHFTIEKLYLKLINWIDTYINPIVKKIYYKIASFLFGKEEN